MKVKSRISCSNIIYQFSKVLSLLVSPFIHLVNGDLWSVGWLINCDTVEVSCSYSYTVMRHYYSHFLSHILFRILEVAGLTSPYISLVLSFMLCVYCVSCNMPEISWHGFEYIHRTMGEEMRTHQKCIWSRVTIYVSIYAMIYLECFSAASSSKQSISHLINLEYFRLLCNVSTLWECSVKTSKFYTLDRVKLGSKTFFICICIFTCFQKYMYWNFEISLRSIYIFNHRLKSICIW